MNKEGGTLTRVGAFYNAFHNFFRSRVKQFFCFLWHFALIRNVWTGQAEPGVDKPFKRVEVLLNFANFYARRYHSMDCVICADPVPWFLIAFPLQTPKPPRNGRFLSTVGVRVRPRASTCPRPPTGHGFSVQVGVMGMGTIVGTGLRPTQGGLVSIPSQKLHGQPQDMIGCCQHWPQASAVSKMNH